jgi:hypothetical protein
MLGRKKQQMPLQWCASNCHWCSTYGACARSAQIHKQHFTYSNYNRVESCQQVFCILKEHLRKQICKKWIPHMLEDDQYAMCVLYSTHFQQWWGGGGIPWSHFDVGQNIDEWQSVEWQSPISLKEKTASYNHGAQSCSPATGLFFIFSFHTVGLLGVAGISSVFPGPNPMWLLLIPSGEEATCTDHTLNLQISIMLSRNDYFCPSDEWSAPTLVIIRVKRRQMQVCQDIICTDCVLSVLLYHIKETS